jgi:mercuric reductase
MNVQRYDLIVIGAGSAARDAANRAANEYGARVAMIERERWGGSCPNVACTPTKAYLVAAELVHAVNTRAAKLGIEVGPARANLRAVKARKDALKKTQLEWREGLEAAGFDTYEGTARFLDARSVRVDEEAELTADRILIATGSRTAVPPIDGLEGLDWLDHVSALELEELPGSLLVVGGGAVGLELGQAFSRFGSTVTIVDALDQIAPGSETDAAAELQAALEDEGIRIVLGSLVRRVVADPRGCVATLAAREDGESEEIAFDRLLLASGRLPNIEELNLDAVGVETSKAGIVTDEHMRTGVPGIWAAGDVNGQAPFTPAAQYQARIAVDDMYAADGSADYSVLPTAIFTDPELAAAGLTEGEASEEGHEVETVVHPLERVRRATYLDAKHGLYKIVFDGPSRRVLGLHVVAPAASEVVQGVSIALRLGITVDELAAAHHTFPTIGEGVKAAAEKARTTRTVSRPGAASAPAS